jgi:hypothetical protein
MSLVKFVLLLEAMWDESRLGNSKICSVKIIRTLLVIKTFRIRIFFSAAVKNNKFCLKSFARKSNYSHQRSNYIQLLWYRSGSALAKLIKFESTQSAVKNFLFSRKLLEHSIRTNKKRRIEGGEREKWGKDAEVEEVREEWGEEKSLELLGRNKIQISGHFTTYLKNIFSPLSHSSGQQELGKINLIALKQIVKD